MSVGRRAVPLVVVGLLLVPLAIASVAFACGRLATLKLDRAGARPGTTVNAIGRNFNTNPQSSAVTVRFNSRSGAVLWEGRPDRQGRVFATFQTPTARPGDYVIVATQTTAEGRPASGSPGRAPLRVRRAGARSSRSDAATVVLSPAGGSPGSGGLPAVPVLLAPLLLLLAGGATVLVATGRRRSAAPTRHR